WGVGLTVLTALGNVLPVLSEREVSGYGGGASTDRTSSESIATVRALKGDSEPGHRPLQRRPDHQDPGSDRRPGQFGAVRALPGQRQDTIGLPPLIEGVEFEALIADK